MQRSKLLFITGKGGVGKTTVSTIVAQAAAHTGQKTLIVEVNGSQQVPFIYRFDSSHYEITPLEDKLYSMSLTAELAIEDYIVQQLRSKRLFKLAFQNRFIKPLLNGAPGLHNAVQIGKIFELVCSGDWDLIVVDSPATGHGITMLDAARHMMELTQIGPMYEANKEVEAVMTDLSKTAILLVCMPEQLPVTECIELYHRLPPHRKQAVMGTLVNQFDTRIHAQLPDSLPPADTTVGQLHRQYVNEYAEAKRLKDLPVHSLSLPFQPLSIGHPSKDAIELFHQVEHHFNSVTAKSQHHA